MKNFIVGIDLNRIPDYMEGYAADRFLVVQAWNEEKALREYFNDEEISSWLREDEKDLVKVYKETSDNPGFGGVELHKLREELLS